MLPRILRHDFKPWQNLNRKGLTIPCHVERSEAEPKHLRLLLLHGVKVQRDFFAC